MIFSDEFIEKVREANRIEDVVAGYVKLERKGFRHWGLCPFHNEKSASFQVDGSRQMYHCFGCGASGDVYGFVMEYDKLSFTEAVSMLAARAGIELPEYEYDPNKKREANEKTILLDIHKEAAKFFFYRLSTQAGSAARKYTEERGLSEKTIKEFALGYSDKTGNTLYRYLKNKNYTDAQIKDSGLCIWNESRSQMTDKFWNRLMFPIMDVNRHVIAFGGRVLGDGKPKYLNSPETKIFDKSKNLYGLYAAKHSKRNFIMLCEGYMDVISMHQAGFTNAVASLGTALTSQQCALLHRYTKEVRLLYDSDEAGVKAAIKAVALLRRVGMAVRVVDLKPFKDPDELVKAKGAEELETRLQQAENGFMFSLRKYSETLDLSDPQNESDFLHEAAKRLAGIEDEIERNSYTNSISRNYNIPVATLEKQTARLVMQGYRPEEEQRVIERESVRRKKGPSGDKAERNLLSWISRKPEIWDEVKDILTEDDFSVEINRKIARSMFERFRNNSYTPAAVLNQFEDSDERAEAASVIESVELPEDGGNLPKAVKELLYVVKSASLEKRWDSMTNAGIDMMQQMMEEKRKLDQFKIEIEKMQ